MANEIQMNLVNKLIESLQKAFDLTLTNQSIIIEIPKNNENGDYSTNLAMQLAKSLKQNPRQIATKIIENFDKEATKVEKIEIAGAGFINFFINKGALGNQIKRILEKKDEYGKNDTGKGISYNIEFVSANPTGDLHLGHARQAALGDSICRLLSESGYEVTREYYINDAGNQVLNLAKSLQARYYQIEDSKYKMPEEGYHGEDVINIAKNIYHEYGNSITKLTQEEQTNFFLKEGIKRELAKLQQDLLDFRVEFNIWSSETEIRKQGFVELAIEELNKRGYLYTEDNAIWFKSSVFGDDKDRVIVKSDGTYTYLTPDIAYHIQKLSRGYDYLVDLLGADHHGYIARMKAAIQALGHSADKLSIEMVQMVRLLKDGQEVKMSKRTGNAVSIRELCEEVGIDAVRYFFVSRSAATHLDFDLNLAVSATSDNPVYYAQYAHARICQIIESAKKSKIDLASDFSLLEHLKEIDLIKYLLEYEECIIDAAKNLAPYKITNYIQKLAQLFHSFYNECKVVDIENLLISSQRLGLIVACKIVIKNALRLIGVEAPEKM